jgi:hypothetical protein
MGNPTASGDRGGGAGTADISLTRIYLPFAMVIAFGGILLVAGYTAGGIMSGLARDKTETDMRLSAIEREVTAIKSILSERMLGPPVQAPCRAKP